MLNAGGPPLFPLCTNEFIGGLHCVVLLRCHTTCIAGMASAVGCAPRPPGNGILTNGYTPL